MATIPLYVDGTRLRIDAPRDLTYELGERLIFTEKRFLQGWEKRLAARQGLPTVEQVDVQCYSRDKQGRICTDAGFLTPLERWLKARGYTPEVKHIWSVDKERWKFDWDRVRGYYPTMDEDQMHLLSLIVSDRWTGGYANLPTGWGKGDIIGALCVGFKKLKIHVIVKGRNAISQRLEPELASKFVDHEVVFGGRKTRMLARVLLISADSLGRVPKDKVDLVLCDEARMLITDSYMGELARYWHSIVWGFDACLDKRIDGKNYRRQQLFGDVRFKQSFKVARDKGRVLPVVVIWHRFRMDIDPASGLTDDTAYRRHAFWANDLRNEMIAQVAKKAVKRKEQFLIATATLEHALELRRFLPQAKLVYGEGKMSDRDLSNYVKRGLMEKHEQFMTWDQAQENIKQFASGEIPLAIATTVWNYGVSFNLLRHIFYASAIQSYESCQQVSGRLTRKSEGKLQGYHHDSWDCFSRRSKTAARARFRVYQDLGYYQIIWSPASRCYVEFTG